MHDYKFTPQYFISHFSSLPRHEIEEIICVLCDIDQIRILVNPDLALSESCFKMISQALAQRSAGVPLSYITHSRSFYGRDFYVDSSVLIPRPESEHMVDLALATISQCTTESVRVTDLGTGSGNLIITMLLECDHLYPPPSFYGYDISPDALAVARKNARIHGVSDAVSFQESDLFASLVKQEQDIAETVPDTHIILANLPYVDIETKHDLLSTKDSCELVHEPEIALWSSDAGLSHYKRLISQLKTISPHLANQQITCLMEIDPLQETSLVAYIFSIFPSASVTFHKDYRTMIRVCAFTIVLH